MTDNLNNGASAPVAQEPALKSTDTSELKALQAKAEPAPPAEPEQAKPKPEPIQPADEAPQKPEGDEGDEHEDVPETDSGEPTKDGKSRWKKRLERVRRAAVAETEARIRREIQQQQAPAAPVAEPEPEKTVADFDFDTNAYTAYLVDRALAKKEQERVAESKAKEQAEAAEKFQARIAEFESREGEGAWHEVVTSPINTDPKFKPLCDLFVGDDHDLDIALALANDIPEAERLLSLSPLSRARELAKLAEQFSDAPPERAAPAAKPEAPVLPPKKLTNAPPPPKTVAGAGKATVDLDDPSITPAQRIAEWRKRKS